LKSGQGFSHLNIPKAVQGLRATWQEIVTSECLLAKQFSVLDSPAHHNLALLLNNLPAPTSTAFLHQRDTNTELGQGGRKRFRHFDPHLPLNHIGARNPKISCLSAPYPTNSPQLSKLDDMSKLSCIRRGRGLSHSVFAELQIIQLSFIPLAGPLTRLIHQVPDLFYIIV
jgi:hypothetical protein